MRPAATKDYLAQELRAVAAKASPANAAQYEALAVRAESGEFDATQAESEEWARAQTDPEVIRMMGRMGISPDRSNDH